MLLHTLGRHCYVYITLREFMELTQLTALKVKKEVKFSYLKMIYSNPRVIYSYSKLSH